MISACYVLCAIAIIGFTSHVSHNSQAETEDVSAQTELEVTDQSANSDVEEPPEEIPEIKALEVSQLSSLSTAADMQVTNLHSGESVPLTQASNTTINDALSAAKANVYDVGFVMIDITTGKALSSNCNEQFYGASSIKGPFAEYICQNFLDTGATSLDTQVPVTTAIDSYGGLTGRGYSSYTLQYLLQTMIEDSSNDALQFLSDAYNSDWGFSAFAKGLGANLVYDTTYAVFPFFTPLDLASMWFGNYTYLKSGSANAAMLSGYMHNTVVSFIRDGLPSDVSIDNKAGYNVDDWYGGTYNGCVDGAYFACDGHDYIMAIMSNRPGGYSDTQISSLATSLFDARGELL